jgi:hypothetical protein
VRGFGLGASRRQEVRGEFCSTSSDVRGPRPSSWTRWSCSSAWSPSFPPPHRPLLVYHGLPAPRARWRSAIVPPAPDDARVDAGARSPRRWPWARLLHRVFAIEVLVCPHYGGARRILGAVTEPHAVRRCSARSGWRPSRRRTVPSPLREPPSIPASTPSRRRPSLPADPWEPVLIYVSPSPSRPALALAGPGCRARESGHPGNAPAGLTAGSGRGRKPGFAPPGIPHRIFGSSRNSW